MSPEEFIDLYGRALATQRWAPVDPLIHDDACVTFSTGAVHKGKVAVRAAFEANFAAIENEQYAITNVHWVARGPDFAAYLFDFSWTGRIGGRHAAGSGRGTTVLVRDGDAWQLLAEHLGPAGRHSA